VIFCETKVIQGKPFSLRLFISDVVQAHGWRRMLHGRGWRWEPLSDGGLIGRATGWAKRHHGVASALQCGVEKILFCSEMLYS